MCTQLIIGKGKAATLCLLMFCSALSSQRSTPGKDVSLFPLPAWQGVGLEYGDQLMLRLEAPKGRVLLLKHSRRDTVYRYDATNHSLTFVGNSVWQRADTPVAECGKQSPPPTTVMRIDSQSHKLLAGERAISTAGRTVLKMALAPSGKRIAVLSASGNSDTSIIPFTGGSGASGQYYHQILALPEGTAVSQPVRLSFQREYDSLNPCWSAEEQYIVYYQVTFNYLSIVTTSLSTASNSQKVSK